MQAISSRLMLISVLATAVVALDWSAKLWAQSNVPVIYNDRGVQWEFMPLLLVLFVFLLAAQKDWLTPVALGLIAGGWIANIGERAWVGPVTDFIPMPGAIGLELYGNVADIAVIGASLLFVFVICRSIVRGIKTRQERKNEPSKTQSLDEDDLGLGCSPRSNSASSSSLHDET